MQTLGSASLFLLPLWDVQKSPALQKGQHGTTVLGGKGDRRRISTGSVEFLFSQL